jgi:hypothetical protein
VIAFMQQAAKTNHSILPFLSKKLNNLKRKNNKNIFSRKGANSILLFTRNVK